MARKQKKTETATEADWSFTESAEVMQAVELAARKAAREFELVEYDDAYQDALLFLAVRPERVERAHDELNYKQLAQDIYSNGLRDAAVEASNRSTTLVSYEAAFGEGEEA